MYEVYTLQEVVNEIRDQKARLFMETLPYEMQVKQGGSYVTERDQVMVDNFSKDTGDFVGLSQVDRMVIAMGVSLSREKNEF